MDFLRTVCGGIYQNSIFQLVGQEWTVNKMADLSKRNQTERLTIAESLVSSVWKEYLNGSIDEENLQIAVNIQVNVNRIVWKLNEVRDEKK